jgi:hypothetical protein
MPRAAAAARRRCKAPAAPGCFTALRRSKAGLREQKADLLGRDLAGRGFSATFAVIKVGFCWVLPVNYQRVVT